MPIKLDNLRRALTALNTSLITPVTEARDLSGIIKDFEIAYELGWKALKLGLEDAGHPTSSAREAFEQAYQLGWLADEDVWLAMIRDRNLTVHTYNETFARQLEQRIRATYAPALNELQERLAQEPGI